MPNMIKMATSSPKMANVSDITVNIRPRPIASGFRDVAPIAPAAVIP